MLLIHSESQMFTSKLENRTLAGLSLINPNLSEMAIFDGYLRTADNLEFKFSSNWQVSLL
jgi:hypothetical protein